MKKKVPVIVANDLGPLPQDIAQPSSPSPSRKSSNVSKRTTIISDHAYTSTAQSQAMMVKVALKKRNDPLPSVPLAMEELLKREYAIRYLQVVYVMVMMVMM